MKIERERLGLQKPVERVRRSWRRLGIGKAGGSLGGRARGVDRMIPWLFLASAALLGAGVTLPIVSISQFFIFTENASILSAIVALLDDGEYLLAATVATFSIAFPVIKIVVADFVWRGRPVGHSSTEKAIRLLHWLGKWGMLDVLVVALVVFSAKTSGLASASSQPGLYLFFGAVVTSMVGVLRLKSAYIRHAAAAAAPT